MKASSFAKETGQMILLAILLTNSIFKNRCRLYSGIRLSKASGSVLLVPVSKRQFEMTKLCETQFMILSTKMKSFQKLLSILDLIWLKGPFWRKRTKKNKTI